ncbi:MAG: hypothetical protein ABIH85_00325, partial [Candidatus Omnitrophota bacterium]
MNIFLVFDAFIDVDTVNVRVCKTSSDQVYLFPLTSRTSIIKIVEEKFKKKGYKTQIIPSVEIINARDKTVRDKYIKFVSEFPRKIKLRGRNLKEIFGIDKNLSFWWLSGITEKNVYKSDSFNRLVQMDSIVSEVSRHEISEIMFSGRSCKLKRALFEFSRNKGINFKVLRSKHNIYLRENIYDGISFLYFKHVFLAMSKALSILLRSCQVKKNFVLLNEKRDTPRRIAPIMIMTPYPDFDKVSADNGRFKNRYYVHLQEALEADKENVVWISMYVRNRAVSFKESLKYARMFAGNGNRFFMLEEFVSLGAQIKALWKIAIGGTKFLFCKKKIRTASNFEGFNIYAFFENDWYSSFAGSDGYYGLVLYYTFKKLFSVIRPAKCIYPCEMRSWEKALIAARNDVRKETVLFAVQSGTVPKMHLNFFNHPDELKKDT